MASCIWVLPAHRKCLHACHALAHLQGSFSRARQIVIQVSADSLHYGNKLVVEGKYNRRMFFPMIQVADGAGVVVDCGRDVTGYRPGDRVVTHHATSWIDGRLAGASTWTGLESIIAGMLAEYVALNEEGAVAAPSYLSGK